MRTVFTAEDVKNIIETIFNGNLRQFLISKGNVPYNNPNSEKILLIDEDDGAQQEKDLAEYLNIKFYNWKERLVANEANVSQGGTLASRSSRLEMRKRACDEINRMFGLNIDVEYNQDLDITSGDGDSTEKEESEGFDNE